MIIRPFVFSNGMMIATASIGAGDAPATTASPHGTIGDQAAEEAPRGCPRCVLHSMTPAEDMLQSVGAIAAYLGWKARKVYSAREQGWTIPIRKREGLGIYAFKSELEAWLKAEETLAPRPARSRSR